MMVRSPNAARRRSSFRTASEKEFKMIFTSKYEPVEIPEKALTPFVLHRVDKQPDRPALIDGPSGRTLTYGQLTGAIRLVGASLAQRGLGKGDVFAIFCPNIPEYAIAFHAVSLIGGIVTTVNPLYTVRELAFQLNDAEARYLLTIPLFAEKALEAAAQSKVEEVFVFGEAEGATPFAALMQSDGQVPEVTINPQEDLVVLPYSSGTTGLPKGVMLTHSNLVANLCQTDGVEQISEADKLAGVLPFYHIYGMLVNLHYSLYQGATVVSMPRFDLEQFLQIIQDYGLTRAHLVPPILLGLAKHPVVDQYDLSSLKAIVSAAAPLGEDLASACAQRLGCIVKQGYGLTETSPVTHVNPDDPSQIKLGSVGNLIRNTECKIIDTETGEEVGVGHEGEVLIRGPQVMKGYLNNPQATAETIDDEGWLRTGDVGYVDADGYLYIVDRVKELIKYKGFQVAPAELEALLLSHPAVADAAVVPSPDEEAGEIPKAYVVLKGEATADEIMGYVAQQVAPHKKVRRLEFTDEIPKSLTGKILRRVLVEQERAQVAAADQGRSWRTHRNLQAPRAPTSCGAPHALVTRKSCNEASALSRLGRNCGQTGKVHR
jgi:acyl-CoA synthetase (AMP-forming)/AMP-acid ligase II